MRGPCPGLERLPITVFKNQIGIKPNEYLRRQLLKT